IFFLFAMINSWIASKLHNKKTNFISLKVKALIVLMLSLIVGLFSSSQWFVFLQYLNQVPFNLTDPIFFKDVAFYVFSLPFFLAIWSFAMVTLIFTTFFIVLDYFQSFIVASFSQRSIDPNNPIQMPSYNFQSSLSNIKRKALVHITILASFVFILLAGKHYLTKFSIMYSEQGIVVGAGYTDVIVFLPIIKFLMMFALVITALLYIWLFYISKRPKLKKKHIVASIVALYLLIAFFGPILITGLVQNFRVSPNELNLEKTYIENNIKFTKIAYGLTDVAEKDFSAEGLITKDMLERAEETIDNVRLLDWRPLTQTYKQTQEIRLYYDLSGIDLDRYLINDKYTQVMLAPRELYQDQITSDAKTWVNLHMVYTHGFGAVLSPVNIVTNQGLPDYYVKNIPPINLVNDSVLDIDQPRIYYGEADNDYVLVNTLTEEFDYPQGTTNKYNKYDGDGGVVLDSFLKKVFMAIRFRDIKILLSSDLTPESMIMFNRNIQRRINKVTPFFALDGDPYIIVNDGKLTWIQDAYTTTGNFPYSEKLGPINYMRNSVKITVDAFNGDVTYYIADEKDALINTYSRIFPEQFKPLKDMPAELKKHIRYPEDLFKVQSAIYSIYHMNDPTVFYNKEDAWQIPSEIYGTGQKVNVEPYYIIMKLPNESKEEFILLIPFTPIKKDNMVSWFAARSDGDNYGKLLLYQFPKDKLVYGPLQIEAKFDQDSKISEQLTLWSQQGSSVSRGNLLIIPIEDSLIYIEPLYLMAETGQLPQLKRVLVSDGERVVMEETLSNALEALFGKIKKPSEEMVISEDTDLVEEANAYYDSILEAMNQGDWSAFGENFDKLGEVIEALKEE
ncbi:UPF0182 family protein, partial [Nanoarchaeota archaeon]